MVLIPLCLILLLLLGILEWHHHQKVIRSVPLRINVNGIRGKSTVTRLITGIMIEAGIPTVGKTTGTQARIIYWYTQDEEPIKRRPEGPNIREQKEILSRASKLKAKCLVSECMAVNPDYQIVFQERLLQANIGVIVNVLEDHMDVLGPTLDEVAQAFTATIPYKGHLIINESPYVPFFKKEAHKRHTQVYICDTRRISEEYLRKFPYMIFPENAALALTVAEAAGIDEKTALRGMLKAPPDPGAMRILPVGDRDRPAYFANGFAANDAASTLNIWNRVLDLGYPTTKKPVVIMNCRADRVDRTEQFAVEVLPHIKMDTLLVIGETTNPIMEAYEQGHLSVDRILNLEGSKISEIMNHLSPLLSDRVIYGMGNIHGAAEPLCERMEQQKQVPVSHVS